MRSQPVLLALLVLSTVLLGSARLRADVVETKSGARLVGKITKIDAGNVYLSTDYAGDIVVKQKEVTSITTDAPVALRLQGGTVLDGKVAAGEAGAVQVTGANGTSTTPVAAIAAFWPAGSIDPAIAALQPHWKYEATVDIEGTTGNSNQLGTGASFSAKRITPTDTLDYYTAYNRQVSDGTESADQFKAGIDYTDNFTPRSSWFVRDEAGFDRIMDTRFYDTAAAGYGYDLIKTAADTLTARIGLAYRYDDYINPLTPTVDSPAADFEIAHDLKRGNWELHNGLTVVPAFQNFKDVVVNQDSYWQIPIADPNWKLRIGVSNEYNSEPGPGIMKLDTTYYTRLLLDWQ